MVPSGPHYGQVEDEVTSTAWARGMLQAGQVVTGIAQGAYRESRTAEDGGSSVDGSNPITGPRSTWPKESAEAAK